MGIIEKNGLDIMDHLNVEFFQNTIEIGFHLKRVSIESIEFSMVTSGGDNYCSLLYRAKVRYSSEDASSTVSLIVKCIPVEGDREVFAKMNVFGKEFTMYSKALPVIEKMLVSKNIVEQICPRLIYSQEEPINTLVFQDLNDLNLELGNRSQGLDEDHTQMVMKKIGQFHAASMILARNDPKLMQVFDKSMLDKDSDCAIRDTIFRSNIEDMAELVQVWEGYEDISQKLLTIKDDFYDRINRCLNKKTTFKVLNHGDLWVNNCMFKRVNGRVEDLLFIDFQVSYYASPAVDLQYFLYTSVPLNVLITKRYHLLRTYYKALKSTLEVFEYENIPRWEDLKNEMKNLEFIGFWAFEAILPLLSMDKIASKDNGIESFNNENDARRKRQQMFTSERFLDTIKFCLDRFDELGVLD